MIRDMPKFRYKIKEIFGDYYYELMTPEEAMEKIFITVGSKDREIKNQQDIDDYIRDNMNVKVPLDGPLIRIYSQEYAPADENKDRAKDEKVKSLMIWKAHHAFCDGVSVMAMTLASSDDYNKNYFIKSGQVSWAQRMVVRCFFWINFPKMIIDSLLQGADQHSMMKNKHNLSG